jgi:pantoate kinase
MKNSIKTLIAAFVLTAFFSATAKNNEPEKAASFGTGIFINKSGKINVLVDKKDNRAATTLLVKNNKGEVVYSEIVEKGNQKFGRVLNVSELQAGTYEIDVISKNEIQTKSFQLSEQKTERVLSIQ